MKKLLIFGIGKIGKMYVEKCLSSGVKNIKLSDSDDRLWGTDFCGIKIQPPEEALAVEPDLIIISTTEQKFQEIKDQLVHNYNIGNTEIVHWSEAIILSKDEVYNLGNLRLKDNPVESTIVTGKEFYGLIDQDNINNLEAFFFTEKHNTITKWLHYFEAYNRFFSKYRNKDVTILEIGVFKGGSLQMWKSYFQGSNNKVTVYGIDINPACKCMEEDNIKIFIGSQEDRVFLRHVKEQIGKVDILIDDGGHTMKQQIVTMEELFDLVDDDGIYLCEDLHTSYMKEYGGRYKGDSFIEYSKNLIDVLHLQYMEDGLMEWTTYAGKIKSISYYDSMIFIEKMKRATKSMSVEIEIQ